MFNLFFSVGFTEADWLNWNETTEVQSKLDWEMAFFSFRIDCICFPRLCLRICPRHLEQKGPAPNEWKIYCVVRTGLTWIFPQVRFETARNKDMAENEMDCRKLLNKEWSWEISSTQYSGRKLSNEKVSMALQAVSVYWFKLSCLTTFPTYMTYSSPAQKIYCLMVSCFAYKNCIKKKPTLFKANTGCHKT